MYLKLFLLVLTLTITTRLFAQQNFPYASEISAFRHQDSLHFPRKNGILFIGSSSIRKWTDLEQRFADKPVIRRGVGGCELGQILDYYTPYILFPYHPRKIFIYAGENDIVANKPAELVAAEFSKLWELIHKKLPSAKIYFMSIKQSASRAKYDTEVDKANALIKAYLKNKAKSRFIDVATVLYKPGTIRPDSSLYEADYLHLKSIGYDKWQKALKSFVN